MKVLVVPTGIANVASILAGLERAGAEPELTHDADAVAQARAVVLPGVGAFGAGRAALDANGMFEALRTRIAAERPLFAVCLGMQLLAETSDETSGVQGLGVLGAHVGRFAPPAPPARPPAAALAAPGGAPASPALKIPQLGWNRVTAHPGSRYLVDGHAYFANSYRIAAAPEGFLASTADHGGTFCAAVERGHLLACQFHPELSGPWGLGLMRRWLEAAATFEERS